MKMKEIESLGEGANVPGTPRSANALSLAIFPVCIYLSNLAKYSLFGRIPLGDKIKVHNVFLHSHIHLFQINIK